MFLFTKTLSKRANEFQTRNLLLTGKTGFKAFLLVLLALALPFHLQAGTFTANQSGDWNQPAIWTITNPTSGATIPGATDDVVIPMGFTINLDMSRTVNNLNLAGALQFDNNGKKLTLLGDVQFSGTIGLYNLILQPTSTFTFKSGGTIPSLTYGNVVIDIPSGSEIATNVISKTAVNGSNNPVILGSLTVLSGNLQVNSVLNITGMSVSVMNSNASITFGGIANITRDLNSTTNFIALSQGGKLIMENIGKGQGLKRQGNVEFPIGTLNGTFTPAIINNKEFNPATIKGDFGVTVQNGVLLNGTDGSPITSNVVNKTWMVSLVDGDADASLTFKWNASDELPDFTASNSKIALFSNNSWTLNPNATFDAAARTIKLTGLTGSAASSLFNFPLFTVQGGLINPLPVELVWFEAVKKAGEVALSWETASEKNNAGFEVQVSADGKQFEALDFVASQNGNAGYSQRYAYSHKTESREGLVYYRLKQIDLNGAIAFYPAKVVDLGRFKPTVAVFPNPFQDAIKVSLETTRPETAEILVTDMSGKAIYTARHDLSGGLNRLEIALGNQPAGVYLLKATTGTQTYTSRLVKE